jgi:hypothetical protein
LSLTRPGVRDCSGEALAHRRSDNPDCRGYRITAVEIGAGINIVAIHQHMTGEEPRLIFLHCWDQGKAHDLAKAVRTAIGLTSTKVSS